MTALKRPFTLVGVGNAGVAVLDRFALGAPGSQGLLAINNDAESLSASVVQDRITVPSGALVDGFRAIDGDFGRAVAGASAVLLCGGLGGETASFLLPALAVHAKAGELTTLACVSTPFSFEGKRRSTLATEALKKLHDICDAVVVIDNNRLSGENPTSAVVSDSFDLPDRILLGALRALRDTLSTKGPVRVTRADLHQVFGIPGTVAYLGYGSAEGPNRLHEALERALKSPLLLLPGKAQVLREASKILILLRGPKDLSFAEVQSAVAGVERLAPDGCDIKVGVLAEGEPHEPLEISIMTSSAVVGHKGGMAVPAARSISSGALPVTPAMKVKTTREAKSVADPVSAVTRPAGAAKRTGTRQTQATLDLDTNQRGRFDKSEPTIVSGENLDLPTFIRKGIKLATPKRN
jgi:cell division protein FtsZ